VPEEKDEKLESNLTDYKTKVSPDVKMRLDWTKELIFEARTSTGYVIEFDAKVEWGCMPTEGLLASVAGCLAIDVVSFVGKMKAEISSYKMDITAKRNPTPPQYFTDINLHITIKGKNIDNRKMDRAISLSKDKYCSVYHSLRPDLNHTVTYDIVNEE